MLLKDKVVVVCGVGPGLGRSVAVRSAHHGADVVLAARTGSRLKEVAAEVERAGRRALAVPADVTRPQDCAGLAEAALAEFGRVDALVSSAFENPSFGDLVDVGPDGVRTALDTNLYSALELVRVFKPALAESRGSVVMVNSITVRRSQRTFGPYKMAKAGLLALAQTLSTELGPEGIRVNSVAPGYIWADAMRQYFARLAEERGVDPAQVYDEIAAETDLRRLPTADQVADVIAFLFSELAGAVAGQCLDVNAGQYHH